MYQDFLIYINGKGYLTLYGICIGIGILAAFIVIWALAKKGKVESKFVEFISYALIISIVVGFVFAALFQWLYAAIQAKNQGDPIPGFTFEGMTFIGGLMGGTAVFLLVYFLTVHLIGKKPKRPAFQLQGRLMDVISILPVGLTLAHGFGRIGCFFAGCCYGIPTDSFLGVQFPHLPGPVHPTQLYEAAFLFILSFIMLMLYVKKNFQQNMGVYLISYGIFRFLIEYIRGDERGSFVGDLSPSQFWSIVMVVVGIVLIVLTVPISKKRRQYLEENPIVEPEKISKKKKARKASASEDTATTELIVDTTTEDSATIAADDSTPEDSAAITTDDSSSIEVVETTEETEPETTPSVEITAETSDVTDEDAYTEEPITVEETPEKDLPKDEKESTTPTPSKEVSDTEKDSDTVEKETTASKAKAKEVEKKEDDEVKDEPKENVIEVLREATESAPTIYVAKAKRGSRAPAGTVKSKTNEAEKKEDTTAKEKPKAKEVEKEASTAKEESTEDVVEVLREATENTPTVYVAKAKKGSRAPSGTVKAKTTTKKTTSSKTASASTKASAPKKATPKATTAKAGEEKTESTNKAATASTKKSTPKQSTSKATTAKVDNESTKTATPKKASTKTTTTKKDDANKKAANSTVKTDEVKKTTTAAKPKAPAKKKANPHVPISK